jgi:hypothetical protein
VSGEVDGADWTTAVWTLVAVDVPAEFDADTTTRRVLPTSADPTRYELAFAPEMLAQFAPPLSQRFHWYV